MGYLIDGYLPTDDQFKNMTHIGISFLRAKNVNGDITMTSGWGNIDEIIASAQKNNVKALISFGGGDYTLDLNYIWSSDEEVLSYARSKIGHASKIAGIDPPIDTVVLEIDDSERFVNSAERGRNFGFSGKFCIHPSQIPLCNEVFTPDDQEIRNARAILEKFKEAKELGSASVQLDGHFIDYAVVKKAEQILTLKEELERRLSEK